MKYCLIFSTINNNTLLTCWVRRLNSQYRQMCHFFILHYCNFLHIPIEKKNVAMCYWVRRFKLEFPASIVNIITFCSILILFDWIWANYWKIDLNSISGTYLQIIYVMYFLDYICNWVIAKKYFLNTQTNFNNFGFWRKLLFTPFQLIVV